MKQVLIKKGTAVVEEIPAPRVEQGSVLVETAYSCISIGTEISGIREGSKPLIQRAIEQPEHVIKTAKMAIEQGVGRTFSVVKGVLESGHPMGYSAAGTVIQVGEGINDIRNGERVACAGTGIANHAEIINVPRNLLVRIPDNLELRESSTVTLGAIALQGVRRTNPTIGETFLLTGLGIIGQLTAQILRANGCRVIGFDPDNARVVLAKSLGMGFGIFHDEDVITKVMQLTGGHGADGVIITAATPSDEVISQAFQSCRKKGRVVLVGDVGLHLKRDDFYMKEIDFFISTSYGPGRYEPGYEQKGLDYPIGYVRWTENRNMQEYLRLLSEGFIDIKPLIQKEYGIDEAPSAYAELKNAKEKPLMVLLKYSDKETSSKMISRAEVTPQWTRKEGLLNIAVIGGGSFAKEMHLPNLKRLKDRYKIYSVMSRTGSNAMATARQFEARYAVTDYKDILKDAETEALLITTRHNLHAEMAIEAIKAGKHVLVEKPMALNRKDLIALGSLLTGKAIPADVKSIASHIRAMSYEPRTNFMVGFNRRFSPFIRKAKELTSSRINPMIINYRMNAGYIPLTHWVHTEEGGGRNIGEACHIYDLFDFFTEAEVESVEAGSISPKTGHFARNDNFTAIIKYRDGSVCNLVYTALGSKECPKEEMDIYFDGRIISFSNYRKMEFFGTREKALVTRTFEKGHLEELEAFSTGIREGREPIPLWQQVQATEISFEVEERLWK
jgi:predicted dehydrogenase/threonine dehydrogenase-like Zn-dependent dehydrogenase